MQLFAKRKKIYPKRVWGRYRKFKWLAMIICLAIYYLAPFIRWDRGPNAPDQAILIDMASRRAYFFFIEIWPQEVYYLTGILILAAVGLFFITSLLGRVWCGYLCFQTVWTDLFIWVERIVQGDRNARKKLDESPLTLEKVWKKGLTHAIWLLIGLLTGGAWVFYFNDAPTLLEDILHLDIPPAVGGWILALTFTTYLMAGFAREQVCIYMCPYARFQSAMFDKDSLIIGYDALRGEPRGKWKQKEEYLARSAERAGQDTAIAALRDGQSSIGTEREKQGHCIDCSLCVQVCPTGIDIRNGLQMECIACGLCVDACNGVMEKVGLPKGLIRYDTQHNLELAKEHKPKEFRILRPRTYYYMVVLALVGGLMAYGLATRSSLELHVLQNRNPLFVKLSDGSIRNGYTIKILNKTHEDRRYHLAVEGIDGLTFEILGAETIDPYNVPVFADSVGHFRLQVTAGAQEDPRKEIYFLLYDNDSDAADRVESVFISGQ